MYKDAEKQKEANRLAAQRRRDKAKGMTQEGMTGQGMTRAELYQAIRAYPNDQWVNSPEHKELMRRLNTRSVPELEADGYWIPQWKVA